MASEGSTFELEAGPDVGKVGVVFDHTPPTPMKVKVVHPGTWAEEHGLEVGLSLLAVNGHCVTEISKDQFMQFLKARPLRLKFSSASDDAGSPGRADRKLIAMAGADAGTVEYVAGRGVESLGVSYSSSPPQTMIVTSVAGGSWAEGRGIQCGQELLEVNGTVVNRLNKDEFDSFVNERPVSFKFKSLSGESEAESVECVVGLGVGKIGVAFDHTPPKPMMIKTVHAGTWAEDHHLQVGQELLEVNGVKVVDLTKATFMEFLKERPLLFKFKQLDAQAPVGSAFEHAPGSPAESDSHRLAGVEHEAESEASTLKNTQDIPAPAQASEAPAPEPSSQFAASATKPAEEVSEFEDVYALQGVAKIGVHFDHSPPHPMKIIEVHAGTWAEKEGLQVGQELLQVNGLPISELTKGMFMAFLKERPVHFQLTKRTKLDTAVIEESLGTPAHQPAHESPDSLQAEDSPRSTSPTQDRNDSSVAPETAVDRVAQSSKTSDETQLGTEEFVVGQGVGKLGIHFDHTPPHPMKIIEVHEDTWGSQKGLQVGQELLEVNGVKISELNKSTFTSFVKERPTVLKFAKLSNDGAIADTTIARGHANTSIEVTEAQASASGETDAAENKATSQDKQDEEDGDKTKEFVAGMGVKKVGVAFDHSPPNKMTVTTVHAGTWADEHGIRVGQVLVEVNGVKVSKLTKNTFTTFLQERPLILKMSDDDISKDAPKTHPDPGATVPSTSTEKHEAEDSPKLASKDKEIKADQAPDGAPTSQVEDTLAEAAAATASPKSDARPESPGLEDVDKREMQGASSFVDGMRALSGTVALLVNIQGALGLKLKKVEDDYEGVFCVCQRVSSLGVVGRTPALDSAITPEWHHELRIEDFEITDGLLFSVYEEIKGSQPMLIGYVTLTGPSLLQDNDHMVIELKGPGRGSSAGLISLSHRLESKSPVSPRSLNRLTAQRLAVKIISAKNVCKDKACSCTEIGSPQMRKGKQKTLPDLTCTCRVVGKKTTQPITTHTVLESSNPHWDYGGVIEMTAGDVLELELHNDDTRVGGEFCGSAYLTSATLCPTTGFEGSLDVTNILTCEKCKTTATIQVSCLHFENAVDHWTGRRQTEMNALSFTPEARALPIEKRFAGRQRVLSVVSESAAGAAGMLTPASSRKASMCSLREQDDADEFSVPAASQAGRDAASVADASIQAKLSEKAGRSEVSVQDAEMQAMASEKDLNARELKARVDALEKKLKEQDALVVTSLGNSSDLQGPRGGTDKEDVFVTLGVGRIFGDQGRQPGAEAESKVGQFWSDREAIHGLGGATLGHEAPGGASNGLLLGSGEGGDTAEAFAFGGRGGKPRGGYHELSYVHADTPYFLTGSDRDRLPTDFGISGGGGAATGGIGRRNRELPAGFTGMAGGGATDGGVGRRNRELPPDFTGMEAGDCRAGSPGSRSAPAMGSTASHSPSPAADSDFALEAGGSTSSGDAGGREAGRDGGTPRSHRQRTPRLKVNVDAGANTLLLSPRGLRGGGSVDLRRSFGASESEPFDPKKALEFERRMRRERERRLEENRGSALASLERLFLQRELSLVGMWRRILDPDWTMFISSAQFYNTCRDYSYFGVGAETMKRAWVKLDTCKKGWITIRDFVDPASLDLIADFAGAINAREGGAKAAVAALGLAGGRRLRREEFVKKVFEEEKLVSNREDAERLFVMLRNSPDEAIPVVTSKEILWVVAASKSIEIPLWKRPQPGNTELLYPFMGDQLPGLEQPLERDRSPFRTPRDDGISKEKCLKLYAQAVEQMDRHATRIREYNTPASNENKTASELDELAEKRYEREVNRLKKKEERHEHERQAALAAFGGKARTERDPASIARLLRPKQKPVPVRSASQPDLQKKNEGVDPEEIERKAEELHGRHQRRLEKKADEKRKLENMVAREMDDFMEKSHNPKNFNEAVFEKLFNQAKARTDKKEQNIQKARAYEAQQFQRQNFDKALNEFRHLKLYYDHFEQAKRLTDRRREAEAVFDATNNTRFKGTLTSYSKPQSKTFEDGLAQTSQQSDVSTTATTPRAATPQRKQLTPRPATTPRQGAGPSPRAATPPRAATSSRTATPPPSALQRTRTPPRTGASQQPKATTPRTASSQQPRAPRTATPPPAASQQRRGSSPRASLLSFGPPEASSPAVAARLSSATLPERRASAQLPERRASAQRDSRRSLTPRRAMSLTAVDATELANYFGPPDAEAPQASSGARASALGGVPSAFPGLLPNSS
eukprot:TRINITY_DN15099_c1_g1_i1.p1 TRINITY_DN15099_c1_g1~~TRINITY_DN15099_c1_g1_i1.p1  ORF type:complete len:2249 (-),score=472.65 TRINITY_DN15099_c1_g1_i1:360-7106(-)